MRCDSDLVNVATQANERGASWRIRHHHPGNAGVALFSAVDCRQWRCRKHLLELTAPLRSSRVSTVADVSLMMNDGVGMTSERYELVVVCCVAVASHAGSQNLEIIASRGLFLSFDETRKRTVAGWVRQVKDSSFA